MVSSTRDLVVLISDTLSWSDHIHRTTSKAYKMLGLVRRSFCNKLPVSVKKSLYLSLVRSHLMYCSVIWRPHLCKRIVSQAGDQYSMEDLVRTEPRHLVSSANNRGNV